MLNQQQQQQKRNEQTRLYYILVKLTDFVLLPKLNDVELKQFIRSEHRGWVHYYTS